MTKHDMSVFRTQPNAEFKAETELRDAGHQAFVPTEFQWRRGGLSRSRRKVMVPMLRGYVFASGKPSDARHVRTRLGSITTDEGQHLTGMSGKETDPEPPVEDWQPGDAAVINLGPFVGSAVKVIEVRGNVARVEGFLMNANRPLSLHRLQLSRPNHAKD